MKFINTRKISFGSLSLVVSLFGVNVEGAIAQRGQSLQNLPDGNYAYKEITTSPDRRFDSRHFLFRKVGASVTGYHFQPRTDYVYCFKGQLQGLSIKNITIAEPTFGREPNFRRYSSEFYFITQPRPEDLRNYQQVNLSKLFSTDTKRSISIQKCLNLFPLPRNPKISNSIPSIPTSSTPVKQTTTIARYPTNDDFEKVDRTLQASRNPERPK